MRLLTKDEICEVSGGFWGWYKRLVEERKQREREKCGNPGDPCQGPPLEDF